MRNNHKNKILIVDDLDTNLGLLKEYLKDENYLIATVNNAKAAMQKLRSYSFDLILLDIIMPGLSGIELCKQLKSNDITKHIPVIFLTAVSSDNIIIEAFEAGGVDYIKKPFNPEELKKKISNHLQLINYRKELERAKEEAEMSNRAKTNFLSNVSHELRTPLNGIVSTLELLGGTTMDEKQKQLLKIASESADSLTHILNDLLDLTKIESGLLELNAEDFDFRTLIKNTVSVFKPRIKAKGIIFETDITDEIPEKIHGDKYRTRQVLNKLIDNALKFSDKGIVKVSATVEKESDTEIIIRFSVSDQGKGISAYQQKVIFDEFTQIDSESNRTTGGMGIGLSLSRKIVEMMGGKIGVESKLHKGSTFYFTAHYRKIDTKNQKPVNVSDVTDHQFSPKKILVVDDNTINLKVADMTLKTFGMNVILANNGIEALKKFTEENPDMIFMDIQMPEIDGIETTKRIRQMEKASHRKKSLPIIALTASAMKGDREHFIKAGLNDYIAKPFKKEDIIRILKMYS
jgi:signal transduction histidine kinase